jgi:small conductance mechanosensitive channel
MIFTPPATTVNVSPSLLDNPLLILESFLLPFAWKVLGAIVLWIFGGWLIGIAARMITKALSKRLDTTLTTYIDSALRILLKIVLIVAILGLFGVESTSFAALLAAAGVAIGMAWAGLLSNFAAGVFLVVLRPFKVGDIITGGGVNGEVREIGLFATTLDNRSNTRIFVGNNKLFSDNIINHSHNAYVRLEALAQVANGVNPFEVVARIEQAVRQIPNVIATPGPEVGVKEYNAAGTLLYVRPYVKGGVPEQEGVMAAVYKVIADATAGLPVPAPHQIQHNIAR